MSGDEVSRVAPGPVLPGPVLPGPALQWARGGLLAAVMVFLGIAGHVTADGLLPGPGTLLALGVLAAPMCTAFLARPASRLRIVTLLTGGQAVVHLALSLTGGHVGEAQAHGVGSGSLRPATGAGPVLPSVDGHRVGSYLDAFQASAPTSGTGSLAPALPVGHLIDDLHSHLPMMLAHLLAAVLVGLWLAAGERCLWHLLHLTARRAARIVAPLQLLSALRWLALRAAVRRVPSPPGRLDPPRLLLRVTRCVVRRGPPAGFLPA